MFLNQVGNKKGFSIIEILAAIAIISVALTALSGLASFSLRASLMSEQTGRANFLAQELMESLRNFRDGTYWNSNGLGSLAMDTDYYIQENGSNWQIIQGIETIGIYSRKIILSNVQRDGNGNIVESGGANDNDTKKAVAQISWQEKGKMRKVEIATYLTNWRQ